MKDEIKEIRFDHFKDVDELLRHIDKWYEEDDIYYDRWFSLNDLKSLKDYITTLQEENEKIRKMNKTKHKYANNMEDKYIIEKAKNQKAIEYINHENFKRTILVGVGTKKYTRDILNNVLNILQGDDKE